MAGHKAAHATLKGPSVIREICFGIVVGLCAAGIWKTMQWEGQKKVKSFYNLLEKGEISIVPEE